MTIPNTVSSINAFAFDECHSLSNIVLPESITSIFDWAFARCYQLQSIALPSQIASINAGLFYSCSSLTSIAMPSNVLSIGNEAFSGCIGLSDFSILVPNTVSSIGNSAFRGCTALTSIVMPSSMKSIGDSVFCPYEDAYGQWHSNNIQHLELNNGLERIGSSAFAASPKLSGQIVIPNTVTSIGDHAFGNCPFINAVKLSENLSAISEGLFSDC